MNLRLASQVISESCCTKTADEIEKGRK